MPRASSGVSIALICPALHPPLPNIASRLQRPLRGGEWDAERLKPVFRGGLTAVFDGLTLQTMKPTQLADVSTPL